LNIIKKCDEIRTEVKYVPADNLPEALIVRNAAKELQHKEDLAAKDKELAAKNKELGKIAGEKVSQNSQEAHFVKGGSLKG